MSTHYLYGLTLPGHTRFAYIGVTLNRESRLSAHRARWPGITMRTLVFGEREFIYALERGAIRVFRTHVSQGGLNQSSGGGGGRSSLYHPVRPAYIPPYLQGAEKVHLRQWYEEPRSVMAIRKKLLDREGRNVSLVRLRQMLRGDAQRRRGPPC